MKTSHKPRVPMSEQIKLIKECRKSGLTDADWCRQHNIPSSTFYTWVSRCRKVAADQIPEPCYGHSDIPHPIQDVVPVAIVPDPVPEAMLEAHLPESAGMHLDNSHTIEIKMKDITLYISNGADPVLLAGTVRIIKEILC